MGDYSNPVRFYKSSKVTIEYGAAFDTVTFNCNSASYATDLAKATVASGTFVANDNKVILTLSEAVNSISISMPAQVRVDSINVEGSEPETVTEYTYSDVEFRIRCGVDATLADIEGVQEYGIRVTAGGKTKDYAWNETDGIYGSADSKLFVTISLGDAINNDKLTTEFTVCAYVVIDDVTYVSENTKTYSIESMVTEYYEVQGISEVADLYNRITQDLI